MRPKNSVMPPRCACFMTRNTRRNRGSQGKNSALCAPAAGVGEEGLVKREGGAALWFRVCRWVGIGCPGGVVNRNGGISGSA